MLSGDLETILSIIEGYLLEFLDGEVYVVFGTPNMDNKLIMDNKLNYNSYFSMGVGDEININPRGSFLNRTTITVDVTITATHRAKTLKMAKYGVLDMISHAYTGIIQKQLLSKSDLVKDIVVSEVNGESNPPTHENHRQYTCTGLIRFDLTVNSDFNC